MTRLKWGTVGEHYYELGVDRGVLFVGDKDGVPWNGLVSIDESPSGGESKPIYLDGIKINNRKSGEEYAATIHAYASPPEFDEVDGTLSLYDGLFVTNQRRLPFGLSYRTKVGNDVDGAEHAYKIHLIYNAFAAPSDHSQNTISSSQDPSTLSWEITTVPVSVAWHKPTAHLIVDSRTTSSEILARVEDILYGSDAQVSGLPSPEQLVTIYSEYAVFIVTITGAHSYTAEGSHVELVSTYIFAFDDDRVVDNGDGSFTILDVDAPTEVGYFTYDGGTPTSIADTILDGGSISLGASQGVDGGSPISAADSLLDGGSPSTTADSEIEGGAP